ncbi:MAG: hypothetical protein ACK5QW_00485 [Cyanobacteriota bacterium]
MAPLSAGAQVYCSKWAEVVDAPSNVRQAPSGTASVACQLPRNGQRLLVYPLPRPPQVSDHSWYATFVCRPAGRRSAMGMGQRPDYIHRSQVRLLANNSDDWSAGKTAQGDDHCALLWRAFGESESPDGR